MTAALHALVAYRVIAGAWIRAALSYRTSFVALVLGQFLVTGGDFVAIVLMFSGINTLAGFGLEEVALLYGLTGVGIGLADLLLGSVEQLGRRVRDGSLDTMLVRPVPALVQVAADQFALRRLGRITQSGVVLVWALVVGRHRLDGGQGRGADVHRRVRRRDLLLDLRAGRGVPVPGGDAAEVSNAFTYGGNTLTQYPLTVYPVEIVRAVTFLLPLAFVNWYPALYLLGRDDPFDMPAALQVLSPVAALALAAVAWVAWRTGVRHYRSTGS